MRMNPLQIPGRLLDDAGAFAEAARAVPAVLARLDRIVAALEQLDGRIEALREDIQPIQQLAEVRRGIEPLDEDMRAVRDSIDDIEPLVERLSGQLTGMDAKLDDMRSDLAPLGELAEKIPGVGK